MNTDKTSLENESQPSCLDAVSGSKSAVEILAENDVYVERSLCGRYWCYKYQPKGKRIVICSNEDKEVAAKKMINELLALGINFC